MRMCLTISMLLCLSGCLFGEGGLIKQAIKPRPFNIGATPAGSELFQRGWEEGCNSALKAYGNDSYKLVYEYKQDWRHVSNPEYYKPWKDGYLYCRWYSYNWVLPFKK